MCYLCALLELLHSPTPARITSAEVGILFSWSDPVWQTKDNYHDVFHLKKDRMGRNLERSLGPKHMMLCPHGKETRAPWAGSGKRSLANPPVTLQACPLGMHPCPFSQGCIGGSGLPLGERGHGDFMREGAVLGLPS